MVPSGFLPTVISDDSTLIEGILIIVGWEKGSAGTDTILVEFGWLAAELVLAAALAAARGTGAERWLIKNKTKHTTPIKMRIKPNAKVFLPWRLVDSVVIVR